MQLLPLLACCVTTCPAYDPEWSWHCWQEASDVQTESALGFRAIGEDRQAAPAQAQAQPADQPAAAELSPDAKLEEAVRGP